MEDIIMLDVPYQSQHVPGKQLRNTCGAATAAMVCDVTTNDILLTLSQPPNEPLTLRDDSIPRALRTYNVKFSYKRPLMLADIRSTLQQQFPVLILYGYPYIPKLMRQDKVFAGTHIALAVGYTPGGFYVHDPNFWGEREQDGHYMLIPDAILDAAMRDPGWKNLPHQGIVIEKQYPMKPVGGTAVQLRNEIDRLKARMTEAKTKYDQVSKKLVEVNSIVRQIYGPL